MDSPGSYQCICDRGYQLGIDESKCEDIDECAIWEKSGSYIIFHSNLPICTLCYGKSNKNLIVGQNLCMGKCQNIPGSFTCTCPIGYELLSDGISCKGGSS